MEQIKHEKRIKTGTWNIISTYLFFLSMNTDHVPNCGFMSNSGTAFSVKTQSSYGSDAIDHLAADGAGFTGSQVTVVAVGQVNADLGSCLHLELVHGLTSLGDIQLVVVLVAHNRSLLFVYPESKMLSGWRASFLSVAIVLPRRKEKHMFLFGKKNKFWKNLRCL